MLRRLLSKRDFKKLSPQGKKRVARASKSRKRKTKKRSTRRRRKSSWF